MRTVAVIACLGGALPSLGACTVTPAPVATAPAGTAVGSSSAPDVPAATTSRVPTASTTTSATPTATALDAVTLAALTDLLRQRGDALTRRDKVSWLATIADPASADGIAEAQAYDALVALGVTTLTTGSVSPAPGGAATVRVGYTVAGIDRDLRTSTRTVRVQVVGGQVRIVRWLGPADRAEPFDLPGLVVARSGPVMVVGTQAPEQLGRLAAESALATTQVAAAAATAVPSVLVVAPADATWANRLVGSTSARGVAQLAATTIGDRDPGQAALADRVVLHPDGMARLTGEGRRVVLAHELTHVTMRASTGHDVPAWLSEGFAEWVGLQGSTKPVSVIARQLLDRVAASGPPPALPTAAELDPASDDVTLAYQASWIAVSRIARERGPDRLRAFYRQIAGTSGDGRRADQGTIVARAFREHVGESQEQFTTLWRAELTGLARSG